MDFDVEARALWETILANPNAEDRAMYEIIRIELMHAFQAGVFHQTILQRQKDRVESETILKEEYR